MKENHVNRTNVSIEYDDVLIETDDYRSGSIDLMTTKIFTFGFTVVIGFAIICLTCLYFNL